MKRIEVTIERNKLREIFDAIRALGINDATVSEVRGDCVPKIPLDVCAATEFRIDAPAETRIEMLVSAERAAEVIRAFGGSGWRRLIGDGKIFVYEVPDQVRIRNPEPPRKSSVSRYPAKVDRAALPFD
jgi:nitrogen regulatory protein PII